MSNSGKLTRRSTLVLAAAASAALPARAAAPARQQGTIRGDSDADQSEAVQKALDAARASGAPLTLPPGRIRVANLVFPASVRVVGVPGATVLAADSGPVGTAPSADGLVLDGVGFTGGDGAALLTVSGSDGVRIVNCRFTGGATGLKLEDVGGTVEDCAFAGSGIALFSSNSRGLTIRGNRLAECGNGGILVWRDAPGADGSVVSGNRIAGVRASDGGSGQNGNGINIYRADDVVIADNVISDCDFSAIRVNTGKNTSIRGNNCSNCREVAIYSEFAFSGSAIIGNIVDGASGGISITNSDQG
ncbi:MAG TPA: TIGR03808 family TAT-translocated repetitive protein, partial [Devosia sp.]|nr:TIGR03808 family TAT-translocated repetitive protein [Devosia sp.]